MSIGDEVERLRGEARRYAVLGCRAAYLSLFLMLVSTITDLTLGKLSEFSCVANMVTIGVLSITAALIEKTIRNLRGTD